MGQPLAWCLTVCLRGKKIDLDAVQVQMDRRAPGLTAGSTPRCEADRPQFLSGLLDGKLTGAPLCAVIENTNVKSHDYANILHLPRPSHADYTGSVRYGGWKNTGSSSALTC